MEPQFKQQDHYTEDGYRGKSFSGIGQALGQDVSKLLTQHLTLLKLEGQAAGKKIIVGMAMAGFAAILLVFGLIRLIESLVLWMAAIFNWQTPQAVAAVTAIALIALALISGLVGRQLLLQRRSERNALIQEMKEDWRWLQKMFS